MSTLRARMMGAFLMPAGNADGVGTVVVEVVVVVVGDEEEEDKEEEVVCCGLLCAFNAVASTDALGIPNIRMQFSRSRWMS